MAGKLVELTPDTFENEVANGVTLVDFWAPWCGPCRMMTPILEKASEEFEGKVRIVKCNVDDHQELGAKYGITNIPTLIIFKDGEEQERQTKVMQGDKLAEYINQYL